MKVHNDIGLDGGKAAMLVLLDLSAAFDTVEVDTLISTFKLFWSNRLGSKVVSIIYVEQILQSSNKWKIFQLDKTLVRRKDQ